MATTPSTQSVPQTTPAPQRASQITPQADSTAQRASQSAPQADSTAPRASQSAPQADSTAQRASQSGPQTAPTTQRASQSVPQTAPTTQRASQSVPQTAPTTQRASKSAPQTAPSPRRTSQSARAPSPRKLSNVAPPLPPGEGLSPQVPSSTKRQSQSSPSRRSSLSKQGAPSQAAPPKSPSRRPSQTTIAARPSKSSEPPPPETQPQLDNSGNASAPQAQPAPPPQDPVASTEPPPNVPAVPTAAPLEPPLPSSTNMQPSLQPVSPVTAIESSLEVIQAKIKEEKEPERALPYREKPEAKVMRRISLEMRHRMFLMGMRIEYSEAGPMGCNFFVMGEIGKTFVVKLRTFPCCQCGDFLLQRICKHMMFISLRVFRLQQTDHRIWQQALLPKELNALLAHPLITPPTKPAFRSRLRKPLPPEPPKPEAPICCPICFDEIQFFDNQMKIPLGAKRGPKPKLEMGTRRKKEDKVKVEEALAEPWAERIKKFEPLLHCPDQNCQVDGCMRIVHQICYLKWNRYKKMSFDLPRICTPNNFYPCAFKCH